MTDPLPDIDGLIHEPARLRVLALLSVLGRADFMYVLRQSGMSRGNLSVQMTKLEDAKIVSVTKELADGRPRTTYALTRTGRSALQAYKQAMAQILDVLP
ncbi:MAG: transcriptional regulator [Gemmatimonadetes bacterium]|jgi:DNA-binding MarR family transcriptional regulator|nr:transcriptional regulator [Gemmatimonadota bacterium]MBT4608511.1 transcriptional regulator [Gemmatimonadota bacterium]MBT5060009.1 transcriptional regulator [Gemmatimonadota bacterium]MBT5142106.1 transcriptional regulator [Gemmatimonadota bacterium]MBT5589309.1 transcriptional regulator [Gemmatimonadota bacterium]